MSDILLDKVIHKELMVVMSSSKDKDEVIHELGNLLYQEGYTDDAQAFIDDVYLREKEGVTGIGQGIAIPHGKSEAVRTTTVAIAVLDNPIKWETLDGEPVKVVIMFAVRDSDSNTTHILLLQQVATLLAHDDFVKDLKKVKSVDALYELLAQVN
ncbi:PTS sugar transporter subunit IIA [Streptococcus orisasini]|uniref:PTS sugar transporter subunit IIA n=1 Tax=Streptococcus orisasini TaxID=1080071 RepID=UPI00070D6868|nr:fructose PTS transporter subunit IIA [Streptococcus orisasini]